MGGGQDGLGKVRRCLQFDDDHQSNTQNGSDSRNAVGLSRSAVPTAELGHTNPTSLEPAPPGYRQLPTSPLPQTIRKPNAKDTKQSGFGLHLNSLVNSDICSKSSSTIRFLSSESSRSCPLSCNEANQLLETINNDKIEKDQTFAATSEAVLYPHCTKQAEFESLNPLEPIPCEKRRYNHSNTNEELQRTQNKRFKKLDVSDDGGFKHCNCKNTSCLKLFCECFAVGIYCTEPCACQGCFNRPNIKNKVEEYTRQQFDSRNDLAFAPKTIQHATEACSERRMEDGVHTRGCKCKKTMCLRNRCSCYQANEGCSVRCRCNGCQNVYGRKKDFGEDKHLSKKDISELCDVSFSGKLQKMASTDSTLLCTEQLNPHELTPKTPSFQHSNHGKDKSKSWVPSPESAKVADSYLISPEPSGNISNPIIIEDDNKDILDLDHVYQDLDDITAAEFSPRYHETCNISDIPSCMIWPKSPISAMMSFGENIYLRQMDYSGFCEELEDYTPAILEDDVTPLNSGKVYSPNKKRVSPPHATVQTGSKFILKSVPSLSPPTPCINSKDKNPEPRNETCLSDRWS